MNEVLVGIVIGIAVQYFIIYAAVRSAIVDANRKLREQGK